MKRAVCLVLFAACLAVPAQAADRQADQSAKAVFAQLAQLVGAWETSTADGKPHQLRYRLSANGYALVETWTPGPPNLDEARAQYLREGVWISRTTQDKLTRENTEAAQRQASEEAVNPVLMSLARAAAKDAVRQNLSILLGVAGYGDVTVNVRFDGEKEAS